MDFMEKITELRAQKSQLVDQAEGLVKDGKFDEADKISDQMADLNKQIATAEKLLDESRKNAAPTNGVYDGVLHDGKGGKLQDGKQDEVKPFATLGEQLKAIYDLRKGLTKDERLEKVNNAANAMRWISADETDVSSSVFGGVQMYWAAEGATVAASKPQFREMKLDLEKMMGFAYCTDEMLQDAAFMTGFIGNAFVLAADRLLTESVISGDGVGKPLGLLNSGAMLTVNKEANQAAGTFLGANAIKMQARCMPRNRDRLVWLMHPDVEEQLPYLAIQSGEAAKFLWNPEGGLGNFDTQRVLNKPVLFEDSCSALGTKGDVMLVDPMQYILLTKGTAKQDWSIHVEFLTDQNCFRMVYRCNGAPKISKPLTIKNSTKTRSAFVTLAGRA